MLPEFREGKTTQLAGVLLKMAGGQMSTIKLLKLLYIIDREALKRWEFPITFDRYVSMKLGPVLSNTYDLIKNETWPPIGEYWRQYISEVEQHALRPLRETPDDQLSDAEVELAREVFDEYKSTTKWEMSELTHGFSEWRSPPGGGAEEITLDDILRALDVKEEDRREIIEELETRALEEKHLG